MKKHILFTIGLSLTLLNTTLYAQQIASVKGDKIAVSDLKIEPWHIQNTSNKASENNSSIYQNGNIGIGDFSATAPTEKLEVKGNVSTVKEFVVDIPSSSTQAPNTHIPVGVNVNTGELVKFTNQNNAKPFTYLTFDVETKSGEDFIRILNTNISSDEYTVLLINAVFLGDVNIFDGPGAGERRIAPFQYAALIDGSTKKWYLTADYKDVSPVAGQRYFWKLVCLVIQNSQVQNLGQFTRSLDATTSMGGIENAAILGL